MAERKQLLKRFILEWKIKNYSSYVKYTKDLKSPVFQLRSPLSSWQLEVKVSDTYEIQVCLCRQFMSDGPSKINVRLLLCLKTLHGLEIWRYKSGWLLFKKDCSLVSVPLILETDHTMVVTCVMLIMDQPTPSHPNVEYLYRDIKRMFNNDSGTQSTNAILVVGEQKKIIKVHKELLSIHSTVFDDFYRHNDGEFVLRGYSPEVILSILSFLYSGDITILANDRNIFELLSCATALGFSRLIDTLRSVSLIRTSTFQLKDITYKWNYKNFNKKLVNSNLTDDTGLQIFHLDELRCRMAFQTIMCVDLSRDQTLFCIKMWPIPADSLSSSFFMEISVSDKNDCIHLKRVELMDPDSGGIYKLIISIKNCVLFGTDTISFPRHVNFNFKIGAAYDSYKSLLD